MLHANISEKLEPTKLAKIDVFSWTDWSLFQGVTPRSVGYPVYVAACILSSKALMAALQEVVSASLATLLIMPRTSNPHRPQDVCMQQGIVANVIIDHVIIVIATCCHGCQFAWVRVGWRQWWTTRVKSTRCKQKRHVRHPHLLFSKMNEYRK